MSKLFCSEDQILVCDGARRRMLSTGAYETFAETTGELYRSCVKEHGRCVGKVYVDDEDPSMARQVGWIFLKKNTDPDGDGFIETWVTVYTKPPTVERRAVGAEYPTFERVR